MTDESQASGLALIEAEADLIRMGNGPLERHPALVYLASLNSPQSQRTMRTALETLAAILSGAVYDEDLGRWVGGRHTLATLPWGALRFQHTQALRTVLIQHRQPATVNKILSALRGVLEKAYKLGYLSPEDYARASDLKGVKGNPDSEVAGRELNRGELIALSQICKDDPTPAGVRDRAIIAILYACGLRRSELVKLDLADYDTTTGKLAIRHGKGNKSRITYVANTAKSALDRWLTVRGTAEGALFCAINKGRNLNGKRMSTQAVYIILEKRAKEAGIKAFSPHDMRRTFVGDLLEAGADIATVAKLAGHASVTTTARYDRRNEETKRKAAGLLHFPE